MSIISTLFIIIFATILLYQLYKHRPIQKKIFFFAEATAIIIILFIGYNILDVIRTDIISKYDKYISQNYYLDFNETKIKNNNECMSMMISSLVAIDPETNLSKYKGLSLRSYDTSGTLQFSSGNQGLYIFVSNIDSNAVKIYSLEKYFSAKEIKEFIKNFKEKNYFSNAYCTYMKGINEEDQFIPQEIKFVDYNTKREYILGKADHNAITISSLDETNNSNFYITYTGFNTTNKVSKLLEELAVKKTLNYSSNSPYALGSISSKEIKYYGYMKTMDGHVEFEIVVDETALPLHTYLYKKTMFDIIIFIQMSAIVVYLVYAHYTNKKKELDTTRNVFMNAMAHEMKTPASIIKNSTELLRENIHPEKHEHYMDTIEKEADHLNDLLVELLNYTRTNQEYHILHQDITIKSLIEEIHNHYQNDTIHFILDCEDTAIINTDLALFTMIIDNYISNAYDHALSKVQVKVVGNRLEVTNDGQLIDSKDIDHIWDPFYKGDESRTNRQKTGLGLSLVANISKLLKFHYGVQQNENEVTFFIEW